MTDKTFAEFQKDRTICEDVWKTIGEAYEAEPGITYQDEWYILGPDKFGYYTVPISRLEVKSKNLIDCEEALWANVYLDQCSNELVLKEPDLTHFVQGKLAISDLPDERLDGDYLGITLQNEISLGAARIIVDDYFYALQVIRCLWDEYKIPEAKCRVLCLTMGTMNSPESTAHGLYKLSKLIGFWKD